MGKTWILTPASSVWIELVSSTGFFITGIFLLFNLVNCVGKFSKIPWNFIEMVFCIAMAFFYFTCGLDLFVKGSRFKGIVTKCYFPNIDYYLTFGTAGLCFFGVV